MMKHVSRYSTPIISALIFVFAMWQFLPTIDDRDFHRDESRWIQRSEYLKELGDPFGVYWDESTWADGASLDERNRLRAQPPMGSYLIGIGYLLQGEPLPDIGYWNMDHDDAWNAERGNMPSDDQLATARRTTATLTALTAVMLFLIGQRLTTTLGAAVGAIYLTLHPLAHYLATFAGSDSALVFFIVLSALLAARLAEKPTWPRAILLGIAIGFGGATKLSPLGIAIALAAIGGLIWLLNRKNESKQASLAIMLIASPVVAGIAFVASYPYLWRNPIGNSLKMLRYRTMSFDLQGMLWEQVAVDSPLEATDRIWNRFTGAEWSVLGRFFGWSSSLELIVALIGVLILAAMVLRRGLASSTAMIAATIGAATMITVLGMEVDWARYHFPILVAMALCLGVVVGTAEKWMRKGWRYR